MNPVEIEMNFPAEHGGNVFGQFDAYMKKIEKTLHVSLILRDDHLKCIGTQQAVNHAISVIDELLELSKTRKCDHRAECKLCVIVINGREISKSFGA